MFRVRKARKTQCVSLPMPFETSIGGKLSSRVQEGFTHLNWGHFLSVFRMQIHNLGEQTFRFGGWNKRDFGVGFPGIRAFVCPEKVIILVDGC